jgi:hypothetical protein
MQPANPKDFQFANLISSDCSEVDDSIPEEYRGVRGFKGSYLSLHW